MWTFKEVIWGEWGYSAGSSEVIEDIQGVMWGKCGHSGGSCEVNLDIQGAIWGECGHSVGHLRWMWIFRGVILGKCGHSGGSSFPVGVRFSLKSKVANVMPYCIQINVLHNRDLQMSYKGSTEDKMDWRMEGWRWSGEERRVVWDRWRGKGKLKAIFFYSASQYYW